MSAFHLTQTCNRCGFTLTLDGDDIATANRAFEQTHDMLRPTCEATPMARPSAASEGSEQ